MKSSRFSVIFSAVGLFSLFFCTPSLAGVGGGRDNIPAVDFGKISRTPSNAQDITGTGASQEASLATLDNAFLKETIVLHHQIGLLERLIERQSVISKIEDSYLKIGIPFFSPPPPREICVQLPPSIPCIRGYPDLIAGGVTDISIDAADLLPEISPPSPTQVAPPLVGAAVEPLVDTQNSSKAAEKYSWAEVSCAGGRCKAVLVETQNPVARKTVAVGENLQEVGTVTGISFDGVLVSREGKTVALAPAKAPSRGGPVSPVLGRSGGDPAPAKGVVPPALFAAQPDGPAAPAVSPPNGEVGMTSEAIKNSPALNGSQMR